MMFALLLMLSLCLLAVESFVGVHPPSLNGRTTRIPLSSTNNAAGDDIIARARENAGVPVVEEVPMLFDKPLLDDMQQVLLTLERRIKEGPTALTVLDVDALQGQVGRIVEEMRVNQDKKPPRPPPRTDGEGSIAPPSTSQAAPATATAPSLHADPEAIEGLQFSSTRTTASANEEGTKEPYNYDDGEAYDGVGGMGQPKGTVNTYAIPGMEEMTADEYQKALQDSVSNRQAQRRASRTAQGNQATTGYLNSLK